MIKLPPLFGWPWSLAAYRCPYSEFCSHYFVNCLCFPPRGKQLLLVHSKNAALVIHSPEGDYFFYIYIFLKVLYKKDYFTTFVCCILFCLYFFDSGYSARSFCRVFCASVSIMRAIFCQYQTTTTRRRPVCLWSIVPRYAGAPFCFFLFKSIWQCCGHGMIYSGSGSSYEFDPDPTNFNYFLFHTTTVQNL